ncbi:MAG: precorrin-8X methylmutase [Deltaproteobacteria bacterium]|nr:precorrin-8X methylmutase [Deltaproteobacteria bacterium]
MRQMTALGRKIEEDSFSIIDQEAAGHPWPPAEWQIVRRVVHATGDFDFIHTMVLSPQAVTAGIAALRAGAPILADVQMVAAGLNAQRLAAFGCQTHCMISDEDVIALAKERGTTRAVEAVAKAARLGLLNGAIVAVGNAPTALLEAARQIQEEGARPALVVGVPVGFVSAAESKENLLALEVPSIVARGRKGGSAIAVAVIHALLALAVEENKSGGKPEGKVW